MAGKGGKRGWALTGGIGGLAVAAALGFVAWQFADRPAVGQVTPQPGGAVASAAPQISIGLSNAQRLEDLTVLVNGRDVTASATSDGTRIIVPTEGLKDGVHTATVRFRTSNLFARTVEREWDFEVDTVPPKLALTNPKSGGVSTKKTTVFVGRAEPGSRVSLAWKGGKRATTVRPNGTFRLRAPLKDGVVATRLTATDRVGNATTKDGEVIVDTLAPEITVNHPNAGKPVTETSNPVFTGTIQRDNPEVLTYQAKVNGRQAVSIHGSAGITASDTNTTNVSTDQSNPTGLTINGRRFQLDPGSLPQGNNIVEVSATDPAGNAAKRRMRVMVDSTEEFGAHDMVLGARGADAKALNQRLKDAKILRGPVTERFNERTRNALRAYQKQRGIRQTGMFDARTRQAMIGRIVVDLSKFRLRLFRDGKVVKTYSIAIGKPGHATPTGTFSVVNKQVDPAWFPPDSPWAAGLGPIPPGPGNPLGTRWIGTSAPAIGIHGTYAPSSVGTAASHGCMRMHISDVEELYDQVSVGMPVEIRP